METVEDLVEDLMNVLIAEKLDILLETVGLVDLIVEDLEDLIGDMMIQDQDLLLEGKIEVLGLQEENPIVTIMIVMIEEKEEVPIEVLIEINQGLLVGVPEKEMLTLLMNLVVRIKISR
jgi:ethanolamine utilization cobalamin adenosyltransferase